VFLLHYTLCSRGAAGLCEVACYLMGQFACTRDAMDTCVQNDATCIPRVCCRLQLGLSCGPSDMNWVEPRAQTHGVGRWVWRRTGCLWHVLTGQQAVQRVRWAAGLVEAHGVTIWWK
jgi:hypothetical protein